MSALTNTMKKQVIAVAATGSGKLLRLATSAIGNSAAKNILVDAQEMVSEAANRVAEKMYSVKKGRLQGEAPEIRRLRK